MENYNLKEQVVAAQLQQVSPAGVTSATGGEGSSEGQEGEGDDGKKAATTMTTIEDILRENVRLKSELVMGSSTVLLELTFPFAGRCLQDASSSCCSTSSEHERHHVR